MFIRVTCLSLYDWTSIWIFIFRDQILPKYFYFCGVSIYIVVFTISVYVLHVYFITNLCIFNSIHHPDVYFPILCNLVVRIFLLLYAFFYWISPFMFFYWLWSFLNTQFQPHSFNHPVFDFKFTLPDTLIIWYIYLLDSSFNAILLIMIIYYSAQLPSFAQLSRLRFIKIRL